MFVSSFIWLLRLICSSVTVSCSYSIASIKFTVFPESLHLLHSLFSDTLKKMSQDGSISIPDTQTWRKWNGCNLKLNPWCKDKQFLQLVLMYVQPKIYSFSAQMCITRAGTPWTGQANKLWHGSKGVVWQLIQEGCEALSGLWRTMESISRRPWPL